MFFGREREKKTLFVVVAGDADENNGKGNRPGGFFFSRCETAHYFVM